MKLTYVCIAALFIAVAFIAVADQVQVTEIKDNKNGVYKAVELEEGGKFFHDRDYTITNIPKEFQGLTQVSTSADCPGGQEYRLTFNIDRLMSTKHGTADINVRKTVDKIRKAGLQRDTRILKKHWFLMRHTHPSSILSTNPMNRSRREKWNCWVLMR